MAEFQEVIVVGGGAIGAACARELARAGRSVLVIDRGRGTGEAWTAAGGMLAPQIEAHTEDPLFDLGLAGRNRYTELAPALQETTGIDIGLWQEGIAQVAQTEDSVESLKSKVAWQRQQGHLCDWLAADEVATRWPWMGPTHGALWAPEEGALNPVPLVEALLADAQAAGARGDRVRPRTADHGNGSSHRGGIDLIVAVLPGYDQTGRIDVGNGHRIVALSQEEMGRAPDTLYVELVPTGAAGDRDSAIEGSAARLVVDRCRRHKIGRAHV